MKKFMKYTPWLIAGGAIAIAVATRQYYGSKLLLELPKIVMNGKHTWVLPGTEPFIYVLKDGSKLAVTAVEAVEAAAIVA